MSNKKKSASRANALAELDFVAQVQLEDAVRLIGDLADRNHYVDLTEETPDSWRFKVNYTPDTSRQSEIRGSLKRWQGTETRIHATGDVVALDETVEDDGTLIIFTGVLLLSIGLVTVFDVNLFTISLFVVGILGTLIAAVSSSNKRDTMWQNSKSNVMFRDRDYLLQRLIDRFKAHTEVYTPNTTHRHTDEKFWAKLSAKQPHPDTRATRRR